MAKRRGPVLLELIGEAKAPPARPIPRGPAQPESPPPTPTPSTRVDAPPIARVDPRPARTPAFQPQAAQVQSTERPSEPRDRSWLSPTRTLRIPAGYVFFVAAGILGLFALGWALGHRSAESKARQDQAARVANEFEGPGPTRDLYGSNAPAQPKAPSSTQQSVQRPAAVPQRPIVPDRDPREAGLNYYIVDRYDPATAARAVEFLRASGMDVVALPDENPTFHLIVALPGFPRGSLSSPEAKALGDQIRRLGRVWKQQNRGPSDFSSCYLKKYEPSR